MYIKSKMLLPKPEEEDPRQELVRKLMEYKTAKEAAKLLSERESEFAGRFEKDTDEIKPSFDENIRLDSRHILFSPRIEAKLLLLAEPKPTDFVLDAGAFTGYTAAVMAGMTRAVVALESDESVCDGAQQLLIDAQIDNVAVLNLPPEQGFAAQSPFDIVFLDGVVSRIPDALIDQLAENGRLVAVVADTGDTAGKAVKIVKKNAEPFRSTAFEIELGGFLSSNDVKSFDFETLS